MCFIFTILLSIVLRILDFYPCNPQLKYLFEQRLFKFFPCGTDRQHAMQNAPLLPDKVGNFFYLSRPAFCQYHFGAHTLIKMHVSRRQDQLVVMMLQISQFLVQLPRVVIMGSSPI